MGLTNASVDVVASGARVTVTLQEDNQSSVSELEAALATFLFESKVQVR
jgi:fatty-acyl-CoA synthase